MDWNILQQAVGIVGGVASTIAILTWWLSRQFNVQNENFSKKIDYLYDKIISKLDYHEKHDDKRFEQVNNNIWELRLRQVASETHGKVHDQKDKNLSNRTGPGRA